MAYVIAAPEMMTAAAADLATIASNVSAAHMVAAARTVAVVPAAADEVSASIAHLFSQHAASYQALAGQAAAFQEQFVQHLTAGAFSYASIEAALASLLQPLTASVDWFANTFVPWFANTFVPWLAGLAGTQLGQLLIVVGGILLSPVILPVTFLIVLWLLYAVAQGARTGF